MEELHHHPYSLTGADGTPDYLSGLPDEVLLQVLVHLDAKQLADLRCLSKRLTGVVNEAICCRLSYLSKVDLTHSFEGAWLENPEAQAIKSRGKKALALLPPGDEERFYLLTKRAHAVSQFVGKDEDSKLLHLALQAGPLVLEPVLQMGVDPTGKNEEGETALEQALHTRDYASAHLLVRYGARAIGKAPGRALLNQDEEALQILLEAGFDPNVPCLGRRQPNGTVIPEKPLETAMRFGAEAQIRLLLQYGATIPPGLVEEAIQNGHNQIALLLLEQGARPLVPAKGQPNALHYALRGNPPSIPLVNKLLDLNVDPNAKTKRYPDWWKKALENDQGDLIARLLDGGADPNATDAYNYPAICQVAMLGTVADVRRFARAGADLNVLDPEGNTPLHVAVAGNRPHIVAALLYAGADPTKEALCGDTPLALARMLGFQEVVRTLENFPQKKKT